MGIFKARAASVLSLFVLPSLAMGQQYTIAFTPLAPSDTDIFIASSDGNNVRAFLPDPALDYNASISPDGAWVIFTSERGGSADIYRARLDGSELTRLVDHPSFDDQAAVSPDGSRLAFVSSRSGQADIWILDLKSGALQNVTNAPSGEFRPTWSPDGQWLAFSSDRDPPRKSCASATAPGGPGAFVTPQYTGIYVVRPDGSDLRRITSTALFAGSPEWSPDGSRLIFHVAENAEVCTGRIMFATGTSQIAAADLSTGDVTAVTHGEGLKVFPRFVGNENISYVTRDGVRSTGAEKELAGEFGRPSWSIEAQTMVFHREVPRSGERRYTVRQTVDPRFGLLAAFPGSFAPDAARFVYTIADLTRPTRPGLLIVSDADGSNTRVVYESASTASITNPAWSPRGDVIVFGLGAYFQRAGTETARLMSIRPDGTQLTALTDGTTNDGMPCWSPDGRQIVFRVASGASRGLYILDTATGVRTKLETGSDFDTFPYWSPTGDWITFTSYRDGDYEVYRIRPDGTGLARLTYTPGNDAHATVSPDGEWVAFATGQQGFKDESHDLVLGRLPPPFQAYGEIAVIRMDGSELRILTDNSVEDGAPVWVPRPMSERP